jgi:CubicO group peptidase (beta-lactamase class C family)
MTILAARTRNAAIAGAWLVLTFAAGAPAQDAFPPAEPESVGMSSAALKDLSAAVKDLIDQDHAPGAELLVIKNRRTVLREAFGFRDRDENKPMERDTLFCIRSMTKCVVGTAVQMLIDEGRISLDDRASKFLPAFDNDAHRDITIGQLITHTSGLPMSQFLLGRQLTEFRSVREVADDSGGLELEFPPGTGFNYSDAGTDTLTAIIEIVSGTPIEKFLADRIFGPLGMTDAVCIMNEGEPRRARTSSLYLGSAGNWTRYWDPTKPPLFTYFLGSQAMYGTPVDYARLLALWMDGGKVGGRALLSPDAVARGLKPANEWKGFPTGFDGQVWYGQLWLLYVDPLRPEGDRVTAFGHSGSDGTYAWAWPDRDLMVLYFTQARSGNSGFDVETAIDRTLINPGAAPAITASSADLDRVTGYYWDESNGMYRLISRLGDGLQIEIPGKAVDPLRTGKTPQTWTLTIQPQVVLSFDLEAPGPATGMWAGLEPHKGRHWVRMPEQHDLPTPEALADLRARAHGTDAWDTLGTFRRTGTIDMPKRGLKGTIVSTVADADRFRTELDFGAIRQTIIGNTGRVWSSTSDQPVTELKGATARQAILENPIALFGDWRRFYTDIQVVARADRKAGEADQLANVYIVRATTDGANPVTFCVGVESGLLQSIHRVAAVPGMGSVGVVTRYSDYRKVAEFSLPFRFENEYDNPILGTSTIQIDKVETNVQTDPGAFDAPEP